jgi:hypothetical protein
MGINSASRARIQSKRRAKGKSRNKHLKIRNEARKNKIV